MIKADHGNEKSWQNASTECRAYGSDSNLASIHSNEEMAAIQNSLQNRAIDVWIGLQDNSA